MDISFPSGAVPFSWAKFGRGSGVIWIEDTNCSGLESDLLHCSHDGNSIFHPSCYHHSDAGVECSIGRGY